MWVAVHSAVWAACETVRDQGFTERTTLDGYGSGTTGVSTLCLELRASGHGPAPSPCCSWISRNSTACLYLEAQPAQRLHQADSLVATLGSAV